MTNIARHKKMNEKTPIKAHIYFKLSQGIWEQNALNWLQKEA